MRFRFGTTVVGAFVLLLLLGMVLIPSPECTSHTDCLGDGLCHADFCVCDHSTAWYYRCDPAFGGPSMLRPYYGYYRGSGNDASVVGALLVLVLIVGVGVSCCLVREDPKDPGIHVGHLRDVPLRHVGVDGGGGAEPRTQWTQRTIVTPQGSQPKPITLRTIFEQLPLQPKGYQWQWQHRNDPHSERC